MEARDTVPHKEQGNPPACGTMKHLRSLAQHFGGGCGSKNKFTHLSFTYNNDTKVLGGLCFFPSSFCLLVSAMKKKKEDEIKT